jgi:hypothetical protein
MKSLTSVLVFILCGHILQAQQFSGYPSSVKWKQINTDTARIIFLPGAEEEANRIATLIHKEAADTSFELGKKLRKVNIVLHSKTTLANGYVALAPFRSEFYLVPGSNVFEFGNMPWDENLAVHEYRHVMQYNNFRHGLSKGFYYLFGEQGLAFANAITIPDWFFEGDAVHSETALSSQGRGRLSFFLSGYNSLWLSGRNYSWQKLRNGSLKDYVPDHYQLGYLLTNYGYLKYGKDFWEKVTQDASAFKGVFYPFQSAVKRNSGVDYKTFRKQALEYYKAQLPPVETTMKKTKTVSNYYFPQFISADSLVYMKTAYNKIPAFYLRDKNGEQRISQRSISSEEWFSYRKGKIAYTAYSPNPRWSFIDYSDIVLLDVSKGTEKRLTNKQKYYTPDISPSGEKIVAVRINDSLDTQLEILKTDDGNLLKTIKVSNGDYITNPRFVDESRIVAGRRSPESKMSLQLFDLQTNQWKQLIPYSSYSISTPFVQGDTIYFTANFNKNDDIYALDIKSGSIYQLTNRYTGTYYPAVHGDSLAFSYFTSNGLLLEKSALRKSAWTKFNLDSLQSRRILYPVALQHNIMPLRTERFSSKRYQKSTGLLNFHSWAPDLGDPISTFSLYSDNILNTFSSEIFYQYNNLESSHGVGWNASYGGWFPIINAGVQYTFHRNLKEINNELTLDQFEARLGYNIPLDFSKGKMYKLLNFGSNFVFNRTIPTGFYKDSFLAENINYLHHFINWSNFLPSARQQIYPKFGYTVSAAYRHQLSEYGFQSFGAVQLFLPSFANHSIVLTASAQETDSSNRVFSNHFVGARGYSDYYLSRMWRASGNYHFPIIYPDLGFASIVYFQRVRGNVFYDYSRVYSNDKTRSKNLRSTGFEIFFDTKWWNQLPVSFGLRVSHLLDDGFGSQDHKGANWFEFILPVNLIPN